MLKYIQNKQVRNISSISLEFIREQYLEKLTSKNRLVGLIGQRGVGKTTLMLQYLKQNYKPYEYLYFSANDIKSIYDSFPELIIRFSGSSMLNILHEKFDLSRRAVISYVKPLSFREFLKLDAKIDLPKLTLEEIHKNHNEISSTLALENPTLYKNFLRYLQIGYYPFFIEDEIEYKNKLFNACEKVINEDIPSLNKIDYTHLSIFKKFIAKLIYSKIPFKVNIAELCREFEVSHPTLATYLEILE